MTSVAPLVEWSSLPSPKPSRGGMLKAYGNAIVAPVAAEFIGAVMDVLVERGVLSRAVQDGGS